MKEKQPLDVVKLFMAQYPDTMDDYLMPPPIFESMQCDIIDYNPQSQSLTAKMPVLHAWLNPFSTMQGGMIMAAVDNAVGPLSMLLSTPSWTRNMESKYLKPIHYGMEYIYVVATLVEQKRRRLVFEVRVMDEDEVIYAEATVTNWVMQQS